MYDKTPFFYGTGRRKSSVARVRLYQGTGKITINDRDIDEYFGLDTLKLIVRQPLELTETGEKFDVVCRVAGGGVTHCAMERLCLTSVYLKSSRLNYALIIQVCH